MECTAACGTSPSKTEMASGSRASQPRVSNLSGGVDRAAWLLIASYNCTHGPARYETARVGWLTGYTPCKYSFVAALLGIGRLAMTQLGSGGWLTNSYVMLLTCVVVTGFRFFV